MTLDVRSTSDVSYFNTRAASFILTYFLLCAWKGGTLLLPAAASGLLWFLTPDQRSELSGPNRRPVLFLHFPNSGTADFDVTGKVIATEAFGTNLPMSAVMTEAAGK